MVSVIIPVWNDAACLRKLLSALVDEPGAPEIIVVDGGSHDETLAVMDRFPAVRWLRLGRGRGRQMNAGAGIARGEVLLFLHADTMPPRGAIAELPRVLDTAQADFGAFRMSFDPPVATLRVLAFFTRFAKTWACYGDQGIFVRREFFRTTGGFPETPLLEDVHWLRRAGWRGRMTRSPHTVVTSARRFRRIGVLRQTLRNLSILIRDRLGEDPYRLAEAYRRGYLHSEPEVRPASETKSEPISQAPVRAERS